MSRQISEEYRIAAKEWVDADSAANVLEELKTATLSQKMAELGDIPVSRAETTVKASKEWHNYILNMVEARKQANLLKVKLEWIRMRHMERQSEEASNRAEMKLS